MEGTFDTTIIKDNCLKKIIDQLKQPEKLARSKAVSTTITLKEHVKECRTQKESTASAESTLGFVDNITATYHTKLTKVDRLLRQIPYKFGFSLQEYRKIVEYQMQKAGS